MLLRFFFTNHAASNSSGTTNTSLSEAILRSCELRQFKNKSQAEYNDARRSHDLKIAALKLVFVVLLLLLAAWLVKKARQHSGWCGS